MSGVLIIKPLPIAAVPTVTGVGSSNLRTADPNEVWSASSASVQVMDIDMGSVVTIDSFYLGYTNAHAAATWSIATATGLGTGLTTVKAAGPMRAGDSDGPRHHCFARLVSPVASRYYRLTLTQSGATPLYAGVLAIGLAFEKYREFGQGRTMIDTSTRQDLPGGGFGFGEGVTKAQFAWSFVDLTEAETAQLWSLKKAVGLRKPVIVVEDDATPVGMNDAIHYGVFDRFQPYERVDPANTRWAMSHIEWA